MHPMEGRQYIEVMFSDSLYAQPAERLISLPTLTSRLPAIIVVCPGSQQLRPTITIVSV
jgi:hypothetical protein